MRNGLVSLILGLSLSGAAIAQEGYATPPKPGSLQGPVTSGDPNSESEESRLGNSMASPLPIIPTEDSDVSAGSSSEQTPNRQRALRRRITPSGNNTEATGIAYPGQTLSQARSAMGTMDTERPYKAFWSMQLGGQFVRDALSNQKTQSNLGLNLGLNYEFTPVFFLNVNPRFTFRNGHVQAATSTNGRESNMELISAAAVLTDKNHYQVSAGVVDMTSIHSSLLVASSFPAVKLQVSSGEKDAFSVSAIGVAAVPSSATLTSNSSDYDKTPSFGSAGLRVGYNSRTVDFMGQVAQFQYKDIPLNVSTDSVLLGNTSLEATNTPQTAFRYQFQGQEARAAVSFGMTRSLKFKTQGSFVRNAEAPAGYNQAYMLGSELTYIMNDDWKFMPSFTYFQAQPDATIANYNDPMVSTNRVGYAGGLMVQYKKLFRVGALSGDREVVFERTSQAREKFMTLALETLDAPF